MADPGSERKREAAKRLILVFSQPPGWARMSRAKSGKCWYTVLDSQPARELRAALAAAGMRAVEKGAKLPPGVRRERARRLRERQINKIKPSDEQLLAAARLPPHAEFFRAPAAPLVLEPQRSRAGGRPSYDQIRIG